MYFSNIPPIDRSKDPRGHTHQEHPSLQTSLPTHSSFFMSNADDESLIQMDKMGIFERYGVKVLGTSIKTLETSEDRDLLYVNSTLVRSYKEQRPGLFCVYDC